MTRLLINSDIKLSMYEDSGLYWHIRFFSTLIFRILLIDATARYKKWDFAAKYENKSATAIFTFIQRKKSSP